MPRDPGHRSTWRTHAERVALLLCCYLFALVAVNLRSYVPWASHVFPIVGQSLDPSSVDAALRTVEREYVVRSVDPRKVSSGAAEGIIAALHDSYGDRFSRYLTAAQYQAQHADLAGRRTGSVGIALDARCGGLVCSPGQTADGTYIVQVLRNQPADQAGIRTLDRLTAVDGTPLTSLGTTVDDQIAAAASRVRGTSGTVVRLSVVRAGGVQTVAVTRADLSVPSVYSQRFGPVLYLQVSSFDTSTGDDATRVLKQGVATGATGVVLDLRGDGGGYVTSAQALASQFVAPIAGKQADVVVRRGRLNASQDPNSADAVTHDVITPGGVALTTRLVVLVDGNTASAAEIVTACLHDYRRGMVVGEKTFGKGSVQDDFPLPDGSDLHLTVERWYGPSGESIDLHGITPDKVVPAAAPDTRFRLDAQGSSPDHDTQLQAAFAALGH